MSIWNEDDTEPFTKASADRDVSNWTIDTLAFSAKLKVEVPETIAPGSAARAYGTVTSVRWNKYLKIAKPAGIEPNLELLGFNIEGKEKVSLLLRNNGTVPAKDLAPDWIYYDPNDEGSGSACLNCGNLLNCLMYSFLVMDLPRFSNAKDNKILKIIQKRFRRHSLSVGIRFRDWRATS